ncbi:N-acetylglucosamine-6-phosphate deacetylase [Hymenobacter taeanensis]|uniref:N-acetylglucosamine-6-phosphate deacetylase n=1 Tax=Hymenobacter taeanensis TaxID=2735321 RepID=A0A6M6BFZ9_9BACT|nr:MULTISPECIES: N-acetylglucosamine-6-phosphate deacetylase [Hymenobacter]QJX47461.1 N-acetylglucosamine-6-phosphate deacetylase [Hymenobacter taeanensis]UOQ83055.1 N-acetylglucosamine-6-phosphate deacetylase [Hymenobacter sp. 5414T-23]
MRYLLQNCTFYTGTAILTHHALLVENGQITTLLPQTSSLPTDAPVVDGRGLNVAPGLLDLQIYGAAGHLFSVAPGPAALEALAQHTFRHGTTGFMATMPTNSWEMMRTALEAGREFQRRHPALGLLGIHLEGPYINPIKKGAHQEEFIHVPTGAEIDELLKLADGVMKIMTLAPEMATPAVVARLREAGVVLSAGHSNATYAQAAAGFREGFAAATHLFNAMSALQGREPGMVGAIYDATDAHASIIADGIHCDFASVRISKKILQERLFLITDAVTDSQHGAYRFQLRHDHYVDEQGILGGSALSMPQAVRNCVEHVGLSLDESLRMASLYPARVIGQDDKLGLLQEGCTADFFLFDADLQVYATARQGELHWHQV